jgi:hypothetical protein
LRRLLERSEELPVIMIARPAARPRKPDRQHVLGKAVFIAMFKRPPATTN